MASPEFRWMYITPSYRLSTVGANPLWRLGVIPALLLGLMGMALAAADPPTSPRQMVIRRVTGTLANPDYAPPFQLVTLGLERMDNRPVVRLEGQFKAADGPPPSQPPRQRLLAYLERLEAQYISARRIRMGEHGGFSVWLSSRPIPETMVVLMAQEDGTVGAVGVASTLDIKQKEQLLDKPGQGVTLGSDPEAPPSDFIMSEDEIRARFGTLLKIEPIPPRTFLLYFESGKAVLNAEAELEMQKLLTDIAARSIPEVEVVGHTDRVGSAKSNARTSQRRAARIAERIRKEAGLDPSRMSIAAMGESQPLLATKDSVAEPLNRRVEVTVR
ncbi:MAG: OmpA family protein [Magnetococcales bacterium]|nr:OmpA family protein [Magnetococcales bacterium]